MGKKGLNIYHRKDGRWEGRYRDGFQSNGMPKYRSVYARTYAEVKEKLIAIRALAEKPLSACSLTVERIFTEWLNMKKLKAKDSTIANYTFKAKKHLLSSFGKIKVSELSPNMVYGFIQRKLDDGLSAKYVSDMVVILKSIVKYAAKIYHCANPIANVELPRVEKHEMKLFSKKQLKSLKSALLTNLRQHRCELTCKIQKGGKNRKKAVKNEQQPKKGGIALNFNRTEADFYGTTFC